MKETEEEPPLDREFAIFCYRCFTHFETWKSEWLDFFCRSECIK